MKVIQIHSVLLHGDAIGNIMRANHKIMLNKNIESNIAVELFSDFDDVPVLGGKDFYKENLLYSMSRFLLLDNKVHWLKLYAKAKKNYKKGLIKNLINKVDIRIWHFGMWYDLIMQFRPHDIFFYEGLTYPYLIELSHAINYSYYQISWLKSIDPKIVVNSNFMKQDLVKQGFDTNNITILPLFHTYNLPYISHKSEAPQLLAYGRYAKNKAIPELAKACKESNLNLTVFGDNFQTNEFKEQYNQAVAFESPKFNANNNLPPIINCYGKVKSINNFFDNANIYINNSYHEGFGMPLIEAEAHSLPVLARRGTAMDELVKDGYNGYLFDDVSEIPDLASKILKNYKTMSHNAWKHSQNYTLDKYKERFLKIVNSIRKI